MPTFQERVADRFERMSPAERRVAQFFQENREQVLISSAAALAAKADTSDATVVRTTRTLGFSGLAQLREVLAGELRDSLSPADRLTRTLGEVGSDLEVALHTTLDIHLRALESIRQSISGGQFAEAVDRLAGADRVCVFGLGPSSALAAYFVIQLRRFGLAAESLTNSGLLFADDLGKLRRGDVVVILAYGRVYAELDLLLEEVGQGDLGSMLVTDTLARKLRHRVDQVLAVPRGRADMLSTHTATLGLIEALLVGIAARQPAEALASLRRLNEIRERLAGKATILPTRERA